MGTRHNITVTINKKEKVSQYGQWDGYPTGQGETIAEFLRNVDLDKFRKRVWALRKANKKDFEQLEDNPLWKIQFPHMSRDAGAEVLSMIYQGDVEFVHRNKDMSWCEYFYDIDLDKNTVTMNGIEFPFEIWTCDGFMEQLEEYEREWYEDA